MLASKAAHMRTKRPQSISSRPVTQKRVNGLRFSWFVVGSLFGIGLSFLMNLFVTTVIVPQYNQLVASQNDGQEVAQLAPLSFKEVTLSEVAEQKAEPEPILEVAAPIEEILEQAVKEDAMIDENTIIARSDATKSLANGNTDDALTLAVAEDEPIIREFPKEVALKVGNGDTLLNLLVGAKVEYDEAVDVVAALKKTYDPRNIRVGQNIHVKLEQHPKVAEKASVSDLEIKLNKIKSVELERLPGGSFFVQQTSKELTPELTYAGGTINSSLFQTGYDNGVPSGVLAEMVKAYSYDVDFQRQIQSGDQMEVLFEKMVTDEGDTGGYGKILYAMLKLRGKELPIYRYEDKHGHIGFYEANGESIVKALLKTPIDGARISSNYGMRRHPILGYNKMHKGTDFAARTGTPIYAAGDGVVTRKGWVGGYGNYIKIKHNGTYSTAYGHMHKFGKGMRKGARVKQGQIIGYVGSTGRSTGPHLHYEVHKNGKQVNPMKERFKTGKVLKGTELANFKSQVAKVKNQIASMPKSGRTLASNQ